MASMSKLPNHRRWIFRLLAVALGVLPFAVLEGILEWCDLPRQPVAADPFVDLHHLEPLFEAADDGERMEIGSSRHHLFRPASFAKRKSEHGLRVFALGGSTTQGEPFSTETAFPAWLGLCLQAALPDREVECVNCGGLSYASYRVLAILREVMEYEPDLIVIYCGHNEYLEERSFAGYERLRFGARWINWMSDRRLVAGARVLLGRQGYRPAPAVNNPTRLAREVDALLDYKNGLEAYHRDDQQHAAISDQFRWNLRQMFQLCADLQIPVVAVNPVSNTLDCPPMKIEDRPGLDDPQLRAFQAAWSRARQTNDSDEAFDQAQLALSIDPQHAGTLYLLGQLKLERSEPDSARQHLQLARDHDVCPLRAPSWLQAIVQEEAHRASVTLVDADKLFASRSADGIVGDRWLVDHIHPNVEGHQLLGRAIATACFDDELVSPTNADWVAEIDARFATQLSNLGEAYFLRGQQRLQGLRLWTQGRAKKIQSVDSAISPSSTEASSVGTDSGETDSVEQSVGQLPKDESQ